MSHSCPVLLYPGEENSLCWGKGGQPGVIFLCVPFGVWVCVWLDGWMDARAAEVVLFYQSVVRHEWDGRGITRVSGFGLEHE